MDGLGSLIKLTHCLGCGGNWLSLIAFRGSGFLLIPSDDLLHVISCSLCMPDVAMLLQPCVVYGVIAGILLSSESMSLAHHLTKHRST